MHTRPATLAAVVLNFDYGDYVAQAVDSLLAQRTPFDQVVVVDDGSTDHSLEVLARYGDSIELISKPNGGQLSACLAGLRACRTDYVYFLDADDVADPEMVESVTRLLDSEPVKVQFQLRAVDAALRPLGSVFPTYPEAYDAKRMVQDNATSGFYICPPTSGNVFHRQALLDLALDTIDPREFIDGAPALVMPHLGSVVSLNQPLGAYRVHGRNHSLSLGGLPQLLRGEIARFEERWVQAAGLLDLQHPPFGDRTPDYVLERSLMLAALGEQGSVLPLAVRYLRRFRRLQAPAKHRAVLLAWALLLVLPVPALRRGLVDVRRSAVRRPAVLRAGVRLLQGGGSRA